MTEIMPDIADKDALLAHTREAWTEFLIGTNGLTPVQWTANTDPAGWTVKDHVAHVTAWDLAVIDLLDGGAPIQSSLGVSDAAWTSGSFDPINEEIRQRHIDQSVDAVKAQRDTVHARLVTLLEGYKDKDLDAPKVIAGLSNGEKPLKFEFYEYFPKHYREHLGYITAILDDDAS